MTELAGKVDEEAHASELLQNLVSTDFKRLIKFVNQDHPNYFNFAVPDNPEDKKELFGFIKNVLDISNVASKVQFGAENEYMKGILSDLENGNLEVFHRHAAAEDCVAMLLLRLAGEKIPGDTDTRRPLPYTGGNLGVVVELGGGIHFTGNKYRDEGASFLNKVAVKIDLKLPKGFLGN